MAVDDAVGGFNAAGGLSYKLQRSRRRLSGRAASMRYLGGPRLEQSTWFSRSSGSRSRDKLKCLFKIPSFSSLPSKPSEGFLYWFIRPQGLGELSYDIVPKASRGSTTASGGSMFVPNAKQTRWLVTLEFSPGCTGCTLGCNFAVDVREKPGQRLSPASGVPGAWPGSDGWLQMEIGTGREEFGDAPCKNNQRFRVSSERSNRERFRERPSSAHQHPWTMPHRSIAAPSQRPLIPELPGFLDLRPVDPKHLASFGSRQCTRAAGSSMTGIGACPTHALGRVRLQQRVPLAPSGCLWALQAIAPPARNRPRRTGEPLNHHDPTKGRNASCRCPSLASFAVAVAVAVADVVADADANFHAETRKPLASAESSSVFIIYIVLLVLVLGITPSSSLITNISPSCHHPTCGPRVHKCPSIFSGLDHRCLAFDLQQIQPPIMSSYTMCSGRLSPANSDPSANGYASSDDELWPTAQDVAEMALLLSGHPTPLAWDRQTLKRLPKGVVPIKMIGEGAANAVFQLGFPTHATRPVSDAASTFKGWLLRVAKAPKTGEPSRYNYLKQQEFYARKIKPLLTTNAVNQELVVVRGSGIVNTLNQFLRKMDHTRKRKFQGSFIAETNWGLLVEDMRPTDSERSLLFEFKPKWLSQSPSAPPNAIRCRQCAMELYNFLVDPDPGKQPPDVAKPCPLALANDTAPAELDTVSRIAPHLAKLAAQDPSIRKALQYTANNAILRHLRAAQELADSKGPLNASPEDSEFNLAMTIRDCTAFVQIRPQDTNGTANVQIRLGDFDFKESAAKFSRWKKAEQELITKGCYTADWILKGKTFYEPPTKCLLEWRPRAKGRGPNIIRLEDPSSKLESTRRLETTSDIDARSVISTISTNCDVLVNALGGFRRNPVKPNNMCPYRQELFM
ncbi:hypothetical protein G7046_g8981 [Stylonectria norvegica]|nr:hypothetical protein G7046_g8981 [Stylonectria norvegica]